MKDVSKPVAILIGVTVLWFGFCAVRGNLNPSVRSEQAATIQEDEPGWDCATMGNHQCGPTTTADEWPECGAACHSEQAYADVQSASSQAGYGFVCWAEDNDDMAQGYEVLCRLNAE